MKCIDIAEEEKKAGMPAGHQIQNPWRPEGAKMKSLTTEVAEGHEREKRIKNINYHQKGIVTVASGSEASLGIKEYLSLKNRRSLALSGFS